MSETTASARKVSVLAPTGMLGGGFDQAGIDRALEMGIDAISCDAGSTDSGPYYLGAGIAKTTAAAVARDLRILLKAAATARIPLLIGSCGTSGTDSGVDWVGDIADSILAEEGLDLKIARVYTEQNAEELKRRLEAGRIHPLPPLGPLDAQTLDDCTHIVGMAGHEVFLEALRAGADVVLAGRATDTAAAAAVPLLRGMPAGPAWHAAKILECGAQCTTNPRGGGVVATIDEHGFEIEPIDLDSACTTTSVAAHMLYETANPFSMREPAGTLDVAEATYAAIDDRRVRVEGSRFFESDQLTIKLEGSRIAGYETMSFVGIRDPQVVERIDEWVAFMHEILTSRVQQTLGLTEADYAYDLRTYGHNAVLDDAEPDTSPAREVGVMLLVNAADQATATAVTKVANPLMLHLPLPDMAYLPSFAFATSPAEVERGAKYEFVLNHVVDVDDESELFRIHIREEIHA